ncbi:hypothetical protein [Portibacter marinus]|uniref:hypothetical protein n=1 Tax=Portibacter marinus TaxID=2898660 RepID=UPI001F1630DB|nr:hypothetical protein [Portibacter marinus]
MVPAIIRTLFYVLIGQLLSAQGLESFDKLLQHSFTTSDSLQIQILETERDYVLKDKGLRVSSSAGTNEFGDLEQGNIFRVKAGLEWNLLDEGFMDRKVTAELLDIKKKIKECELDDESLKNNYAFIYNHIIYCFNKEKLRFLREKSHLLNTLAKRYEALYHNHAAEYQDLLAIYDKADELTILLLSIDNYNIHYKKTNPQQAPELNPNQLPIVDVLVEDLLSYQIPDTGFLKIQELNLQKNEIEDRLHRQKRLAVYNNIYWRPLQSAGSNRYLYNGFGIRFSTGLVNRKNERARLNDLRNQVDIQKNEEKNFNQQKELSNHLLAYHSKLRLYTRFMYKLRQLKEHKRVDRVVRMVNHKDPQSDLRELNIELEEISVGYELLEIKQQLYLLLLKVYFTSGVESILPFIKIRDILDMRKKLRGERVAVLHSAYESELKTSILVEYLKKNEMYNVIFEGRISQNLDFAQKLGKAGIKVYTGREAFFGKNLVEVPVENFHSRMEMEEWIDDYYHHYPNTIFEIHDINRLVDIDSLVLKDK